MSRLRAVDLTNCTGYGAVDLTIRCVSEGAICSLAYAI